MCFDQVVCVLRAYATLLNFVKPRSRTQKCMSQEALGPPETRPSASRLGGGLPVALGDGKSPLPPSLSRPGLRQS